MATKDDAPPTQPPLRRRNGQIRFSHSRGDRRKPKTSGFDVAAALELQLDRHPGKNALLRLLKTWFAAARQQGVSARMIQYRYALARAIRVMTKAPTAEEAILELQRIQAAEVSGTAEAPLLASVREKVVDEDVLTHVEEAARAMRKENISAFLRALEAAIAVYEKHPRQAQQPGSQLPTLVAFVRSAESICKVRLRPADDVVLLAARAEALGALHH
jgi:hypothetical protein